MSRNELIQKLKEKNPQLKKSELEAIIDIFSESITNALVKGVNVELRDFGRLYLKKIKENFNSRNPRNNQLIYKPERVRVRFKASKKLNKFINE
ncbi:MAG: HU family DNA-binding protein [Pseudomonadota bacterium]|nr:HU family DNA-binding protein [Pseudomonadota bacterium]